MQKDTVVINRSENVIKMMAEGQAEVERLGLADRITKLQRSLLINAKANPLNAAALKDAGLVYLHVLELPEMALRHFQFCLQLDPQNYEYRRLSNQAKQAIQHREVEGSVDGKFPQVATRHLLHRGGQKNPQAASVIRSSGKIPGRITKATSEMQRQLVQDRKDHALDPQYEDMSGDELLHQAQQALETENFSLADTLVHHALKREASPPSAIDVLLLLGDSFFKKEDFVNAQQAYHQVRVLDPKLMEGWFNEALALQNVGCFEEALHSNTKACNLDPENARVWANFSTIQFEMEYFAQAEVSAQRAIELQPDYPRGWDNLAAAQGAQLKYDEAIASCQKALELRPDFPELWFKLGVLFFNKEELEKSRQAFLKSCEFEQGANYAVSYLALIYVREGKLEEAVKACEGAENKGEDLPLAWLAWNNIAMAYLELGEYERAAWASRLSTQWGPDVFDAWFNLAYVYHLSEKYTDAQDAYEQALRLNPQAAQAWHNLGVVCRELHELRHATKAFQKVVEIEPDNVSAWTELAAGWEREGDKAQAGMARDHALQLLQKQAPATSDTPEPEPKSLFAQLKQAFKK